MHIFRKFIDKAQFDFSFPYSLVALFVNPFYIMRKNLYRNIKKYAPLLSGDLLDFGCGSKPYEKLFVNCSKYIGVDIENEGHSHENDRIEYFYDGKKLPFSDNCFDCLFSSEVIEHIDNLSDILVELNRVLKKDGLFLLTTPFVWNENELPHDYARYTSCGLKKILSRHGFKVVRFTKSCNFIEILYQMKAEYFRNNISKLNNPFADRAIQLIIISFISFKGTLLGKLFPEDKSLYGNNIVLCKKI